VTWDWSSYRPGEGIPSCRCCDTTSAARFSSTPAFGCWPASVLQLASAVYDGQDCGFAQHDDMPDAGHAGLAEHFRPEQQPQGMLGAGCDPGKIVTVPCCRIENAETRYKKRLGGTPTGLLLVAMPPLCFKVKNSTFAQFPLWAKKV